MRGSPASLASLAGIAATILLGALSCRGPLVGPDYEAPVIEAGEAEADADTAPPSARIPPRPPGTPELGGTTDWFIVQGFHFGRVDRKGIATATAWGDWGYDLDGLCGTVEACIRKKTIVDGSECRDNAFGLAMLGPMEKLLNVASGFEAETNAAIAGGGTTWVLAIDSVGDLVDDPRAPGRLYLTSPDLGAAPRFDGTDVPTIASDSVLLALDRPFVSFPNAYVAGALWVSGDSVLLDIVPKVPFGKALVPIDLVGGVITLDLDKAKTGTAGVLAGGFAFPAAKTALEQLASAHGVCPGTSEYEALLALPREAADLYVPGWIATDVPCNAVSIGIGFDAVQAMPPTTIGPPTEKPVSTCP